MNNSRDVLTQYLIDLAKERLDAHTVILFGSRARGDAHSRSDYDFAFDFEKQGFNHEWGAFCSEVHENAPTLLPLDLVNLNEVSNDFAQKIHQEGFVVYKKE